MSEWRRYFAYGSNMLPARLLERTPSAVWLGVGHLQAHRLYFNHVSRTDGSAKCNVEWTGAPDDYVWGVVYSVLESERPALDRAEDLGSGYNLVTCQVERQGVHEQTYCYVAVPGTTDHAARPFRWYRDIVFAGARQHRFPEVYLDLIASETIMEDPDHQRAAHHQYLLDMSPD